MSSKRERGFTLIELLTVCAIIAILAGIVAVAAPRALEAAKLARMNNALLQIRNSLTAYYTTSNPYSYPPGYGFLSRNTIGVDRTVLDTNAETEKYHLRPYLAMINLYNEDVFDEFSTTYDTTLPPKNRISLLEFLPIPSKETASGSLSYPQGRYDGNNFPNQVQQMLAAERRPFVYLPYNKDEYRMVKSYYVQSEDFYATTWDVFSPIGQGSIAQLGNAPPNYDAFVLIGVGPGGSTFGVLPNQIGTEDVYSLYRILTLRAVFLALRDLNNNGKLDFDFIARSREGEAAHVYNVTYQDINGQQQVVQGVTNRLPDTRAPDGYGPYIFSSEPLAGS